MRSSSSTYMIHQSAVQDTTRKKPPLTDYSDRCSRGDFWQRQLPSTNQSHATSVWSVFLAVIYSGNSVGFYLYPSYSPVYINLYHCETK